MFNIMNLILIFLTALHLLQEGYGLNKLEERFRWVHINFNFENESARQKALESRQFIPENNIPFGVEVWKNKVFITIPRRSPGVPATLNYFDLDRKESTPLLIPYPDWHSNEPLVDHITSTYRTNADTCDRLWTFDTGSVTGSDGTVNRIQAPRILIFNLNTNTLIKSHHLNSTKFICFPSFINIVPDIRGSCDDAYAYAINPDSSDLLVYSLKDDKSWIKTHSYFFPHPFQMDYKIGELRFQWDDGLFGFALSELDKNGNRKAYLHPMSGLYEFTVDTKLLRDPNAKLLQDQVKIIATRNATYQASATAFDEKSGVLFYSLVSKNGIGCWNTRKSPNMGPNMDIVAADDQTMVYSSDVKVDKNGNLWTISNRLPIILYGNNDEAKSKNVKYRVFTAPIKQLIKNTKCDTN